MHKSTLQSLSNVFPPSSFFCISVDGTLNTHQVYITETIYSAETSMSALARGQRSCFLYT